MGALTQMSYSYENVCLCGCKEFENSWNPPPHPANHHKMPEWKRMNLFLFFCQESSKIYGDTLPFAPVFGNNKILSYFEYLLEALEI